jgi:phage gp45-like
MLLGGGMDRAHILGLEHPQYRPRNLPLGASIHYDNAGNYVKIAGAALTINHASKIVLQVGGNSLTIDSAGFHFASGEIDHDGHKIDKTHVHTNAGGVGLSGPPP